MTAGGKMMHIGELAERSEMSLRSLRHYDDVGLVVASGRTEGGFRLYTEHDLERLMLIRRMKPLGFSLDEMVKLLRTIDRITERSKAQETGDANLESAEAVDLSRQVAAFINETLMRRQKLARQLDMADEFLDLLRSQIATGSAATGVDAT